MHPSRSKPISSRDLFGLILQKLAFDVDGGANDDLISAVIHLQEIVENRLSEQAADRQRALRKQHTELYAECRRRRDELNSMNIEMNRHRAALNNIEIEQLSGALQKLRDVELGKPRPGHYPTVEELEAWKRRLNQAKQKVENLQSTTAELRGRIGTLAEQFDIKRRELIELADQETALAATLAGQEPPEPKLGFTGVAR